MDMKLEIVVVPVSDVDGAKRFYEVLGWRLDADFATGPEFRVVQFTPPGSAASIIFGKGITPLRRERSKASTSWLRGIVLSFSHSGKDSTKPGQLQKRMEDDNRFQPREMQHGVAPPHPQALAVALRRRRP
jgi:catechol 2,3-dioxygenase-like lactoylglutathione lyase family enzyme